MGTYHPDTRGVETAIPVLLQMRGRADCRKIFKVQGNDKAIKCKQCSAKLIDMHVSMEEWPQYDPKTKDDIKHRIYQNCPMETVARLSNTIEMVRKQQRKNTMQE